MSTERGVAHFSDLCCNSSKETEIIVLLDPVSLLSCNHFVYLRQGGVRSVRLRPERITETADFRKPV